MYILLVFPAFICISLSFYGIIKLSPDKGFKIFSTLSFLAFLLGAFMFVHKDNIYFYLATLGLSAFSLGLFFLAHWIGVILIILGFIAISPVFWTFLVLSLFIFDAPSRYPFDYLVRFVLYWLVVLSPFILAYIINKFKDKMNLFLLCVNIIISVICVIFFATKNFI